MDPTRFDTLTKTLAQTPSRRQVLRGLGGSLAGAMLAGLGLRSGEAAKGGNSVCAQWCHATYRGAAAGQCTSQAAHGTGPCYSCAGPAGTPCADGETCQDGRCVASQPGPCAAIGAACTTGSDCCAPNVCANGACAATCPPGSRDCDGVCYPGGCCSDADCGGSCLVCGADHVCHSCEASGQCLSCDTTTGTCVACPAGQVCHSGTCVTVCGGGATLCTNTVVVPNNSQPTCCGSGSFCDSCEDPGQCVCAPMVGGTDLYCPPPQFACCPTTNVGPNGVTCTCCTSEQTCTAGACVG